MSQEGETVALSLPLSTPGWPVPRGPSEPTTPPPVPRSLAGTPSVPALHPVLQCFAHGHDLPVVDLQLVCVTAWQETGHPRVAHQAGPSGLHRPSPNRARVVGLQAPGGEGDTGRVLRSPP